MLDSLWEVCYSMQDPIKNINFSNSNPVCHAFDPDAKDGHDLLIAFVTGDGKIFLYFKIWNSDEHFCLLGVI